ncbi:phosphatase PAP2 family protein [Salinactinospora qingdaonensis]|uniref:Phosphatidic acid phosphatase type 2/haloperoxidase domain-containing protein n=1 Tax=Salinactinospora qingdaonensis TaxID=702744 RepID=A0ABP7FRV0_9ACTN
MAALALFGALALSMLIGPAPPPFHGLDETVTTWAVTGRETALTAVATLLHYGGMRPWGAVPMVIILAPLAWARRWSDLALVLLAWIFTSAITVEAFKELLGRPRPPEPLVATHTSAFPSGHTAYAAVMGMALVAVARNHRAWALAATLAVTVVMAWSRIYLGAHWLSDTVGGALLGWGIALLLWGLWPARPPLAARQSHPAPPPAPLQRRPGRRDAPLRSSRARARRTRPASKPLGRR